MRVVMLTRQDTDYSRVVDTFLTDFTRQTGKQIEVLDPDSPEADIMTRAYDIVEYPTIIALSEDGHMQTMWTGESLPTIGEVSYYVQ